MPKKGFKVISVHDRIYDDIKRLAEEKGKTIAGFVEDMYKVYTSSGATVDKNGVVRPIEIIWPWPGPYVDEVTRPEVKRYMSTAWIFSEQYPERIGTPQLDPKIMDRIRDEKDFSIEKVIVVSQKAWDKIVVWRWIFEWFNISFEHGDRVKVFVVDERKISKNSEIDKRFFDMGIYGENAVGFLQLKEDWEQFPEIIPYLWLRDPRKIKEAREKFERLKDYRVDHSVITERFSKFLGQT
jgi:hypothetical protein